MRLRNVWRAYRVEGFLHCRSCYSLFRACQAGRLRALGASLGCRLRRNWS